MAWEEVGEDDICEGGLVRGGVVQWGWFWVVSMSMTVDVFSSPLDLGMISSAIYMAPGDLMNILI